MTKLPVRIAPYTLIAVFFLWTASSAQDKQKPEQYAATWAVVGGTAGGNTVGITVRVNRYNTEQDILKFAELLKEGGPDELRRALEKEDVGQISPTGRVGTPIAVARKLQKGNKTVIRVVTARNLSFVELRYSGRSVDYPFTILQLELDEKGKGSGTAIAAAKIRFDKKKGQYEIESYQHGTAYNKLLNVYRMD